MKLPSKDQIENDLMTNAPDWWAKLPIGQRNQYKCSTCQYTIITFDRDRGVTPMTLSCSMCQGQMSSNFYRADQNAPITHVWYRPDGRELKKLLRNPATR